MIGAVSDSWMLRPAGRCAESEVTLEAWPTTIDHVCQMAGNARHAAIGSDLDGGYGTEQTPVGLETIADIQKIPAL